MIRIDDDLKAKLASAKSDNEACAILVEEGLDVDELERELSDSQLESVSGGWSSLGCEYKCPWCGESNRDNISYQFWASLFMDSSSKYRCCTCNNYFIIKGASCRPA